MFIAMKRFQVKRGSEAEFERVWRTRDTRLEKVPGFVAFHLLKGPGHEGDTLCSAHTPWASRGHFEAWARPDAFREAHRNAGENRVLYRSHPMFEGLEIMP